MGTNHTATILCVFFFIRKKKERKIMPKLINFSWLFFGFQFSVFNCTATLWRIPSPQHSFSKYPYFSICFQCEKQHLHLVLLLFKKIYFSSIEIVSFNYFFSNWMPYSHIVYFCRGIIEHVAEDDSWIREAEPTNGSFSDVWPASMHI